MTQMKTTRIILTVSFSIFFATSFAQDVASAPAPRDTVTGKHATPPNMPQTEIGKNSEEAQPVTLADSIIAEAKRHLGKRYVHGTAGPNTFDCSGFTSYVMSKFGINLSRSSSYQYTQGIPVTRDQLQPGDLVFFKGRTAQRVGHVGLVVSVEPEKRSFHFIHAATSRGIVINDFASSAYYIRRYVSAKRVLQMRKPQPEKKAEPNKKTAETAAKKAEQATKPAAETTAKKAEQATKPAAEPKK